ncbi:MAG: YeeE/YedE family protein [Roseiflexus sp.]|nr:YeeE/YedE family protein [Roseiflexus sp.]MCS7290489.1 YeeE/YedE family protein [Roseiflexus sp.]MDW8148370.1 YeeE/YedE family protein [Roseiflexaceae bacterium]MDW8232304.1 YeeE/YedE family protein [Roseiflexaceae bacterium]
MSNAWPGSSPTDRAASSKIAPTMAETLRYGGAAFICAALLAGAYLLQTTPGRGASAALSLLLGAALGVAFERGRFCFFCIFRDFIEQRNAGPLYAILMALAVSGIGYAIVFGAFLPNPASGRLAPDAHIGPVSPALVVAGLVFGLGMTLSGACISGHLYRLGEGSGYAPLALAGALIGFGLGFQTWNWLYVTMIAEAPVVWLPHWVGYGGSLLLHLAALGVLALALLRHVPPLPPRPARQLDIKYLCEALFRDRWNPLVTGALVGIIGVAAYLRIEPLGVTSQLGSITRTVMSQAGWLPARLNGLDSFAGCATQVVQTINDNGWLIAGLALGSFGAALLAGRFQPALPRASGSVTALLGGVLMGWGAMTALGCTVGTLLSGIAAFALSGWIFGAAVFAGVWCGIALRLHRWT